ncbi:MAG: FxsA family protein [Clostridiales bacterium]
MKKKHNILGKLILLFTIVPLVELYLLYRISLLTNWIFTFSLVIITGFLGAYLAKKEGYSVFIRIKNDLRIGKLPGEELINGLCILIGAAFLLTPGTLTDIVGFSLIIPITRCHFTKHIKNWFSKKYFFDTKEYPKNKL